MAKALEVYELASSISGGKNYFEWADLLRPFIWQSISKVNWPEQYPYCPSVSFQIAYSKDAIILHYVVEEDFVKASAIENNQSVWEDSCVEFFVSLDQRETYYNVEFNPLGAGIVGYGASDKSSRQRKTPQEIDKIDVFSTFGKVNGKKSWSLVLVIPFDIFNTTYEKLKNQTFHANFYKCGDSLPNPHFISWAPIEYSKPNFHLPEFFGELKFK